MNYNNIINILNQIFKGVYIFKGIGNNLKKTNDLQKDNASTEF